MPVWLEVWLGEQVGYKPGWLEDCLARGLAGWSEGKIGWRRVWLDLWLAGGLSG